MSKDINQKIDEIKRLYELANSKIKELEVLNQGLFVPPINELRYAGEHIVRAATADNEEAANNEINQAEIHCKRAIADSSEISVLYALEKLQQFQKDYRVIPISEHIPAYQEIIELGQKLQTLIIEKEKISVDEFFNEVNKWLPVLVEKLSEIEKSREILNKELKKKQRHSKQWLIATFIGIVASLSASYAYEFLIDISGKQAKSSNIQIEIKNLDTIQSSLSQLQKYVTDQQQKLNTLDSDIKSLSKKKETLKKAVDTDEEAVKELLNAYEASNTLPLWLNLLLSFIVGSLSSLFVVFLVKYLKTKRIINET